VKTIESEALAMDEASFLFMASITHEIANPLTGMHSTVQFLEQQLIEGDEINPDEIRSDIRNLKSEIDRLLVLLDDLRQFVRSGRLNVKPVSLQEVATEIIAMEQHDHHKRGIRAELEFPLSLPCVMADRQQLKQVLLNLCKNAAEAMPDGGRLVLRGIQEGDEMVLEVEDTGRGVSEEEDLFEPFITTKPDGLGLGLAIARQIVAAHGGLISYNSKPNKGTTFRIALPLRATSSEHLHEA
jgi:signal transduction histidine kinase